MLLYSFMLSVVLTVGAPYWLFRMATSERYRAGLGGRLGSIPDELRERVAALRVERRGGGGLRPLMWIHAVSVGEVLAAARLIDEFREGEFQRKRPGMVFAVSTTTEAGKKLAEERLQGCAVFYFPLDFAFVVKRYLRLLSPEIVVLIESELWPQLMTQCEQAGIPLVVANARISDRSFPRYMRLKALWRPLLAKVAIFLAQSEETAERLRSMGAQRVEMVGNIKYDARVGKETPLVTALRGALPTGIEATGIQAMGTEPKVVVCGSTLEGEEAALLAAWPSVLAATPTAVLVIAPRHPKRFDEVAAMSASVCKDRRLQFVRASNFMRAKVAIRAGSVIVLDTIGDLATMYGVGQVAFVGGSLVDAGGHNPLEPAQFGVPVMMGPSYENFREIVAAMLNNDAVEIVTKTTLTDQLTELVRDGAKAEAMGARAKAVFEAQSGAAARTAAALLKLLPVTAASAEARR